MDKDRDYETVIIGRKSHLNTKPAVKIMPKTSNANNINIDDLEEEIVKLPIATYDIKTALQKARVSKGLTQDQLNEKLSLTKGTIRDYENGKAVLNQNVLNKINRVLGSSIKIGK